MPNWVDTIMTIHGNSDDLRSFMEKAARPYTTYFKGQFIEPGVWDKDAIDEKVHDEPLSFMNFVSPTNTETYYQNQLELSHGGRPNADKAPYAGRPVLGLMVSEVPCCIANA